MSKLARKSLNALGATLLAGLAWHVAKPSHPPPLGEAQAAYACKMRVLVENADNQKGISFEGLPLPGHHFYAFVMPERGLALDDGKPLALDRSAVGAGRYLTDVETGWVYLLESQEELSALSRYAVIIPEPGGSKGGGYNHGVAAAWLNPDVLPGLPAGAQLCSNKF